jgi:hypothetical protein
LSIAAAVVTALVTVWAMSYLFDRFVQGGVPPAVAGLLSVAALTGGASVGLIVAWKVP